MSSWYLIQPVIACVQHRTKVVQYNIGTYSNKVHQHRCKRADRSTVNTTRQQEFFSACEFSTITISRYLSHLFPAALFSNGGFAIHPSVSDLRLDRIPSAGSDGLTARLPGRSPAQPPHNIDGVHALIFNTTFFSTLLIPSRDTMYLQFRIIQYTASKPDALVLSNATTAKQEHARKVSPLFFSR
jgi:hypothetical protein